MPPEGLYTGPHFSMLEDVAFEDVLEVTSGTPGSVLYLTRQSHPEQPTQDRWADHGRPGSLSIQTLDRFVSDCYERDQYKGQVTHVDQALLYRVVELGLEELDDVTNPLDRGARFPSAGFCYEAENLFTHLEFAGLLTPAAIRDRLQQEGLEDHAADVGAFATEIEAARETLLRDSVVETFRSERLQAVIDTEASLADLKPAVEAVIVSDFSLFQPIERQLLARIVDTWPTVGLVPQQAATEPPRGVDTGAQRALAAFEDAGFGREHVNPDGDGGEANRQLIARHLFRHPDTVGGLDEVDPSTAGIELIEPETIPEELRHVARDIRQRLTEGVDPEDIGILVSDSSTYLGQLEEVFEDYEIPVAVTTDRDLTETAVGQLVQTLCGLARKPRFHRSMLDLLTNPLVTVTVDGSPLDLRAVSRAADRVTSKRLDPVLDELDPAEATALRTVVEEATALAASPLDQVPEHVDALFERLGVRTAIDDGATATVRNSGLERAALKRIDRAVESIALTDGVADLDVGDAVDRLERALGNSAIQSQQVRDDGHVIVCGLPEATTRSFERAYGLGFTEGQFPSNPETLAFTRPIHEAHPDFERSDIQQESRQQFAGLLTGSTAVTLSVPARSIDGEPFVEADVITELRRITGLDPEPVDRDVATPGTQEDVQQSISDAIASDPTADPAALIRAAADAGSFGATQRQRALAGTECAAARSSPQLTPYDGQLSHEIVDAIYDRDSREPYSPSRIETYAACGFKFYMGRVLEIEGPEEVSPEPDALERGGYVHDVFEAYYKGLQAAEGEPVELPGDSETREEHLLNVALDQLESAFEDARQTAFQDEWLLSVLAGLGSPESNPYYVSGTYEAPEQGLFVRFLDHESEAVAAATARPTWFEARVGEARGDETVVQEEPVDIETPFGTVPISGMVDRIDTVPESDPTEVVVRDYKTGNTPNESETLTGLSFQLPLYALLAETTLGEVETVGGAYYAVSPPTTVNHWRGLIGSQEHTTWAGRDDAETPMTRWGRPTFETHDAFRRFLDDAVPARVGRIVDGIEAGRYHPTVLDPYDAGCSYCEYADVCDVRSHMRRETIDAIEDDGGDAYIPPIARDAEPDAVLEVE